MTDMTQNLDLEGLGRLRNHCRAELAKGRIWPRILEELESEGYRSLDLQLALRGMGAWNDEARRLKAEGWPYEDLVMYLSEILATGQDIAWALLEAGLRPADMLRAVLPVVVGTEFEEPVVNTAQKRNLDPEECRQVRAWFFGT